jgi:hypothetical protein
VYIHISTSASVESDFSGSQASLDAPAPVPPLDARFAPEVEGEEPAALPSMNEKCAVRAGES